MHKKKQQKKEAAPFEERGGFPGANLDRLKRLSALPLHRLDWRTEIFLSHFLGGKRKV